MILQMRITYGNVP